MSNSRAVSDNENSVAASASNAVAEEITALFPIEAYQALGVDIRPIVAKLKKGYVDDPDFRDSVRRLLELPSLVQPMKSLQSYHPDNFPFMRLPAELRLMVAEYALSYDGGLTWRWKCETPGTRVGGFVDKQYYYDKTHYQNPLTRLCVSRQLRDETSQLWLKSAVLHFDGANQGLTPQPGIWSDRSVEAYTFFSQHPKTKSMAKIPTVMMDAIDLPLHVRAMRQLTAVTQESRLSDIRVVQCVRSNVLLNIINLEHLRGALRIIQRNVRKHDATSLLERCWRVYPGAGARCHLGLFRKHLSAEDFALTVAWMENGF
ncbi:hypothetical protein BDU57DRAFT_546143 [Ampelomyces quisqualis]|uniref:Uncharacterized protein n=1 Tax=Ampelomyces quisqualis TaxID=50730 RepID=A0A6A5QY48_AMPQU|nr:hypothetical protein BDU57DRAFT_546143 [Ampelomyces quisqualis]